ncbi:hypothetical protein [Litoreibacter roseus]|uniref:Uncharacterized protein n=1 Tax=Litoreibacter roseus TaxID=2601869 RepID=A0A6N6JGX0_9RHOB|nr:hypothetical protein [Litoreibacter roseus]GFE65571.1 hypothetical protein KIN_26450 [Litoreibacter roseus]
MIILSSEFKGLHSKIYTFSFFIIVLQFLPIKSIKIAEIEIDENNKDILAGAFAIALILILAAAICYLIRDFFSTAISDNEAYAKEEPSSEVNFSSKGIAPQRPLERYADFYVFWSQVAFAVEGIAPLVIGIFSVSISRSNVLLFLQNVVVGG